MVCLIAGIILLAASLIQDISGSGAGWRGPALIIGADVGSPVAAAAKGIVDSVKVDEETGTTVSMNIGNGYELTYGQLKEVSVKEGDVVEDGGLIGYVSEPSKYYCEEGSNLYFKLTKDGTPVDPFLFLGE